MTPLCFWEDGPPVWRADSTASVAFTGQGPPLTQVITASIVFGDEAVLNRLHANEKRHREAQATDELREAYAAYLKEHRNGRGAPKHLANKFGWSVITARRKIKLINPEA
jgi:hypothetical protein